MSKYRAYIEQLMGNEDPPADLSRSQRLLQRGVRFCRYTGIMLIREHAPQMAAALAYRTIFSLIPVIVLSLVFMRALLGDQGIREQLDHLMEWMALDEIVIVQGDPSGSAISSNTTGQSGPNVPGETVGAGQDNDSGPVTLAAYLGEFVDNAVRHLSDINFGAITVVGVLVFIYAALSLLIQIEGAFNRICRAPEGRRFINRVTSYWTLLTLGTLLIFFSIAVGTNFGAMSESKLGWAYAPVHLITRFGATWLVLLFAYRCMPNARVGVRSAAVGAAVAAVLWEFCKAGLTWFVKNAIDGQVAIYGSLAVVPLFLFWVYVTWLIVLLGLQIAVVLQIAGHGATLREHQFQEHPLVDGQLGVVAVRAVAERFIRGEVARMDMLANETGLPESILDPIMIRCEQAGIVRRLELEREEIAFTLGRPVDSIAVASILGALEPLHVDPCTEEGLKALESLRRSQREGVAGITLATLIAESPAHRTAQKGARSAKGVIA